MSVDIIINGWQSEWSKASSRRTLQEVALLKVYQVPLFEPIYQPRSPQWGGHQGLPPTLRRINRVLHLAATNPHHFNDPHWGLPYGTQAMGKSALFWAVAFKLLESTGGSGNGGNREEQYFRLSARGRLLLESDPYFESLSGGGIGNSAAPLLWVLHWWLVSSPCLSKGVSWLFGRGGNPRFTRERLLSELTQDAGGDAGETVLKDEVRVLLEIYLTDPLAEWETVLEHPFWALDLLRYDEMDAITQMRQLNPKAFAKYDQAAARSRDRSYQLRSGFTVPIHPDLPKPSAAALRRTHIEFSYRSGSGGNAIPPVAMFYAVLDYIQSQMQGNQKRSGCLSLAKVLYENWECPGIALRFTESAFHAAFDQLKQQKLLEGLSFDYLPDAGGNVLVWSRPLAEMQQAMWDSMIKV